MMTEVLLFIDHHISFKTYLLLIKYRNDGLTTKGLQTTTGYYLPRCHELTLIEYNSLKMDKYV